MKIQRESKPDLKKKEYFVTLDAHSGPERRFVEGEMFEI